MQTRRLGKDGPQVSALGYGAMSFTDFYGPTDEAESHAILDLAMETGVTHLDTSNVYGMGRSESVIGAYLHARPEARDFFSIATKAGIATDAQGRRAPDNSLAHLEAELDKSLKRLGVECVDLFYVHRRQVDMPIEAVTEGLATLVAKGKTRGIGFSEIAPTSLARAHAVHPVAAVQSEYSLSTRAPELGLVQTCAALGTTLVAFSPVGRSLLTDTPLGLDAIADIGFLRDNPRFQEPNYSANIAASDRLRRLARDMGEPTPALAIAWLLTRGDHVLPIPGTRSPAHFRALLRGAELTLSQGDLDAIERALPVGWTHGDRYGDAYWTGVERYC
ncbi:aryl-alcohol dehydrogenase-like predicted oxidoreductase [Rhodovulum iodosum]|uniref:Aryl-alcohol dehydrogenase-like predicted oxidoreductase n=1 Tax=Rhodovulum iodosum TaxID=68291 RepID=A0ABV3XWX6_9RHOB|nr:aldo/keto reductase [Rhodovulum robiginosum]RSK34125.1 aldo/keto reductase [Rhodovulum robiginosum]